MMTMPLPVRERLGQRAFSRKAPPCATALFWWREEVLVKARGLGLILGCVCACAADLPKLPPETMGLIDQARALPPEFSADTLLTLAGSRVVTQREWRLLLIEEAFT